MRRMASIALMLLILATTAGASSHSYRQDGSMAFAWVSTDKMGVYTEDGKLMRYVQTTAPTDPHEIQAEGIMALAPHSTFYAIAPYTADYKFIEGYTQLPISYSKQQQSANDDTQHLAACDYMTAQATSTDADITFHYKHLGCLMRIAAFVPKKKTFTALTLRTGDNEPWFINEATMNASNNILTPVTTDNTAALKLNNIDVEATDSLKAYIMLAPTDLTERIIVITLYADDGAIYETSLAGFNIKQGKAYSINIKEEDLIIINPGKKKEDKEEILSLRNIGIDDDNEDVVTEEAQIIRATFRATDFEKEEEEMKNVIIGDVNEDGTVDMQDAILLNGYYLQGKTTLLNKAICDVNADNNIDIADVIAIVGKFLNGGK